MARAAGGAKGLLGTAPAFSENIAHRPWACTRKNSGNNRLDHPGDNGIRRTTVTFIDRGAAPRTTFGTLEFPFDQIRQAAKSHDLSVNDAFMAAVMTGMQAYHERHGATAESLRVNVPISLRGDAGDRSGQGGERCGDRSVPHEYRQPVDGGTHAAGPTTWWPSGGGEPAMRHRGSAG